MKQFLLITAALSLSACSTVKMPNLDLSKLADFRDQKIKGDYPDVSEAPEAPTDVRSDAEWDEAAAQMVAKKNTFEVPGGDAQAMSDREFDAKLRELTEKVHAYKADDPK